jgi:hypothetical protein
VLVWAQTGAARAVIVIAAKKILVNMEGSFRLIQRHVRAYRTAGVLIGQGKKWFKGEGRSV